MVSAAGPTVYEPWSVWFARLSPTIGREQLGDRPVIVVGSAVAAKVAARTGLITIVPVTRTRRGLPWQVDVELAGTPGAAMVEQIRTISTDRVRRRFADAVLSEAEIAQIVTVMRRMLAV